MSYDNYALTDGERKYRLSGCYWKNNDEKENNYSKKVNKINPITKKQKDKKNIN